MPSTRCVTDEGALGACCLCASQATPCHAGLKSMLWRALDRRDASLARSLQSKYAGADICMLRTTIESVTHEIEERVIKAEARGGSLTGSRIYRWLSADLPPGQDALKEVDLVAARRVACGELDPVAYVCRVKHQLGPQVAFFSARTVQSLIQESISAWKDELDAFAGLFRV